MKHIQSFESFLNEGSLIKKSGDGEIAVKKNDKAKVEKVLQDMGLNFEDEGPKDSSQLNYFKIADVNWDTLNKIGSKVDLQSMTILESVNEAFAVNTSKYKGAHGKEPRGHGLWCFSVGGEKVFTPQAMNYTDAVNWVKKEAKERQVHFVEVQP